MNVYGPPKSVVDRLPEERKEMIRKNLDLKPVNIRVLDLKLKEDNCSICTRVSGNAIFHNFGKI